MINLKDILSFDTYIASTDKLVSFDLMFATDNRDLNDENIFIAIVGERFNPLKHLNKVVESDCRFVVYEKNAESDALAHEYKDKLVFIEVTNITEFIQEAGRKVAKDFKARNGKIIAISGSNGKTTTKEMLFHILSEATSNDKIICTQKNYNNHIGVPFTLFQISETTEYAIVELGSNHPGEIEFLCKMIAPQFGVCTNIGDTHLEFFGNRENVFLEEGILHSYADRFFVNNDDELLVRHKENNNSINYGINSESNRLEFLVNSVKIDSIEIQNLNITGKHNFYNLAVAYLMAKEVLNKNDLVDYAASFKPTSNRSEWIKKADQEIFLDAYNANPSSMIAAIKGFSEKIVSIGAEESAACVIMGDMNELGENANEMHKNTSSVLVDHKFGQVIYVGRYAKAYLSGFDANVLIFNSSNDLRDKYQECIAKYKYVFIKGSRSLQLETILDIK